MEQKLSELLHSNDPEVKEHLQRVKSSFENGSYFNDGLEWYFFRCLSPVYQRTILLISVLILSIALYFLVGMVRGTFPLVSKEPIFIKSPDQSLHFSNLIPLRPQSSRGSVYNSTIRSVDEAVLQYLLSVYVKDREGYDFRNSEVQEVNKKFNRIRNISSKEEYINFQKIMSKANPNSPLQNFGKNIVKSVTIDSVNFIRKDTGILNRQIIHEAEVRFTAITAIIGSSGKPLSSDNQRYLAKISFDFEGVKKNKQQKNANEKLEVKFMVNGYKLFKIT